VATASPLFLALDLTGVFAFALNGARTAIRVARLERHRCVVTLGVATALGGGIVRDVFLDSLPPATLSDRRYLAAAVVGSLVAFTFGPRLDRWMNPIFVLDAAGLSLFAVSGAAEGAGARCRSVQAVILGAITAVGGGPSATCSSVESRSCCVASFTHPGAAGCACSGRRCRTRGLRRRGGWGRCCLSQ
jgi:uncharacterized membrane protein YeiH